MCACADVAPITSPMKPTEEEELDEEDVITSPAQQKKRKRQSRITDLFAVDSPPTERRRSRVIVDDDSGSDTLDHITVGVQRQIQVLLDDEEEEKSGDEEERQQDDKEAGKGDLDDSDEDAIIIRPGARRQRTTPSPSKHRYQTPTNDDDSEDLLEEVRELTSSVRKNSLPGRRTRDPTSRNKRKSQFQKNLDSLKKRKQGLSDSSEEEEERGAALYDSMSDVESVASKDFVVEDEGDVGEELMEMPPEFTSLAYQGPQLNFKVVVQAEVYALLHPDYADMDYSGAPPSSGCVDFGLDLETVTPYFRSAFKSLERQVTGITDSAISSHAWKPWFVKALKSRPEFESEHCPGDLTYCDACNTRKW
jgi:Domain of unknown function (DUF4211)